MKILQLAPRFVFPPDDGGKIGIANIYKYFHLLGNEPYLFCYDNPNDPTHDLESACKYGKVEIFNHSTRNTPKRILGSALTNRSIFIEKHKSLAALERLYTLFDAEKFDVVHCDHTSMAWLGLKLRAKFGVPVGLRLHNVEYRIWEKYAENLHYANPKRYYILQQANALRREEQKIIKEMDVNFAITDDENALASAMTNKAKIITAGVGVDLNEWKPDLNIPIQPFTLIIATTYHWVHNVDGLIWFIEKVLPILKQKYPTVKLKLLGKNPPEKFREYSNLGVEVVGYVDRVQPYFSSSEVYIAPLFVGAGVRIKILEAMAMGLPVVATKVSASGISAGEADGLFVTDNESETAAMISKLFDDSQFRQVSGERARQFVVDHFSWEHSVGLMLDQYTKLLRETKKKI